MDTPPYVALIRGESNGQKFHATGIAIATDGLLVTCHHVIVKLEIDAYVEIKFPNRKVIRYYPLSVPDSQIVEHDIVFLVPEVTLEPLLTDIEIDLAPSIPNKGAELIGYGWANRDLFEAPQEHRFIVSGFIQSYGRIGLDGHVNPGDSGGPLFDENGKLTGIIQWKDDHREGHGAAIPATTLGRILGVPQRRRLLSRCVSSLQESVMSITGKLSSPAARELVQPSGRSITRDVILISCSSHKRSDGEAHPRTHTIADTIANERLVHDVFKCRRHIRELLQLGSVDGTEFQEGNRGARPENRELIAGPDFGGRVNEPKYLRAYLRYTGRCYQVKPEEWSRFFALKSEERPIILVLSGLYGLIDIREYIQNYDCHLTDTVIDGGGGSLQTIGAQ